MLLNEGVNWFRKTYYIPSSKEPTEIGVFAPNQIQEIQDMLLC